MFRYPGTMTLREQHRRVACEVDTACRYLGGIALPTTVNIKQADIFRRAKKPPQAVVQTQPKLDLSMYPRLDLSRLQGESPPLNLDEIARNLEAFVQGSNQMITTEGFYPDISPTTDNLRVCSTAGTLSLIDVLPFYANGSRLIGDHPPGALDSITQTLRAYEEFIGFYGSSNPTT